MNYPESRLRRLRYNKIVREMFEDINILPKDLIYPIFVCEGKNIKNKISSLDGQYQISIDNVIKLCEKLICFSHSMKFLHCRLSLMKL